ncbi:pyrimidine operon attenuation protein / uracil phosphoribosyltransferase [Fodinibius roseus]|uniref:Pyrimidine operon attenuation protein / uracil phosphoribosyltransferase n=1 Tax=Fodinibius roseus TaxID=1194090 RepID=A0A1M4Y8I9_9BACT|nr:phosphoribosyltransferase family protein [Fodinibius roseus]SHF02045.1 pyrimidine operon attenuation protein / uracil phosphoribosyltransferase [Fodinibius roseus]
MSTSDNLILMTNDRITRSLKRMAHEINERNKSDHPFLLFGINQRGLAVAKELGRVLSDIMNDEVKVVPLNLEAEVSVEEQGRERIYEKQHFIVLVDDVIFSGRTMFHALTTTVNRLEPSEIHTAVLIDRGHRKYPVKAEFYGMKLPTKLDEHVAVVVEDGKVQEVQLTYERDVS